MRYTTANTLGTTLAASRLAVLRTARSVVTELQRNAGSFPDSDVSPGRLRSQEAELVKAVMAVGVLEAQLQFVLGEVRNALTEAKA